LCCFPTKQTDYGDVQRVLVGGMSFQAKIQPLQKAEQHCLQIPPEEVAIS
jgi:hypothetical protein